MFPGWLQDFFRMTISNERSKGTRWSPTYSMIPAIRWSPAIWWSPAIHWSPVIRWSIGSVDFDNPKVYGDTFISDGLVCTAIHDKCLRSAGLKQNVLSRCHTGKCFGWEMPKNNVNFRPKQMWNKKYWNKQICFRTQVRLLHCIGWPFNHLLSG